MVNLKRPTTYKPKPFKPPVDSKRPAGYKGQRKPFLDPEDVAFATLVGPDAIKDLIVAADAEITAIRKEVFQLAKRHLNIRRHHTITVIDCDNSPIGVCVAEKSGSSNWDRCIYCTRIL